MSSLLSCQDLGMNFGARMLFENITLHVNKGEKIGLIGPNGAGKSTLMKILAGIETPTSGARSVRRQTKLGYLPQNDILEPEQAALEIVVAGLADSPLDAHDRETRAMITLGKVGFEDLEQKAGAMSGGWRKRLAIARELAREPDVLLLDEPTNHLDLDGILWLEEFLSNADFDFIVCSHDRYLLDHACTRVVELNRAYPSGSFSVDGDYQFFLEKRAEFLEGQLRQQQAIASKVRREVEWLRRGPKARTHKAKFRMDDAGRLQQSLAEVSERNSQQKKLAIDFTGTDRRANKLLAVKGITKTLGGKKLFDDLSFILEPGSKLGLLGVNGSGKSTLLKILLQQLEPDKGQVLRADGVRIAVFDQNRQQLDQTETLRRSLAPTGDNVAFQGRQMHIEAWAKMFLFRSEQLDMQVGSLSGGEQARILIARLMNTPADLLLLDEPTNDLDIPSLEVLENSLIEFAGAVILVTHDRFLLERVSTAILGLDADGVTGFYQDYEDWNEARREREKAKAKPVPAPTPKPVKPAPAKAKKLTYAEQKEREQMEEKIMMAEEAVQTIEAELAQPGVSADHRKLADCCQRLEAAQAEVQRLYSRWEELEKKA